MIMQALQRFTGAAAYGRFRPVSRKALFQHFTSRQAAALTDADISDAAARLGATAKQIGAARRWRILNGYDKAGMPKILYEPLLFHRMTDGRFSPGSFSQSAARG